MVETHYASTQFTIYLQRNGVGVLAKSAFMLWLHRFGSLPYFYRVSRPIALALAVPGVLLAAYGVYGGLVNAPVDYQQGDAFRILYIHVPSAWLSLFGYTSMAIAGAVALVWRLKLAEIFVVAALLALGMLGFLLLQLSEDAVGSQGNGKGAGDYVRVADDRESSNKGEIGTAGTAL